MSPRCRLAQSASCDPLHIASVALALSLNDAIKRGGCHERQIGRRGLCGVRCSTRRLCHRRRRSQKAWRRGAHLPQIQAEIDAQDATARREAGKARSLEAGASAYQAAEWLPVVGGMLSLVDMPTDASGARAMARAGSARDDALIRSDYLRRLQGQRCTQATASQPAVGRE